MTTPPTHPVDVFLLLRREGRVLLGLRQGTGYADGTWNLPSGKLELDEDAVTGVRRESLEETGLHLPADDLELATVVHARSPEGQGRVGLVFSARHDPARHGEPFNAEPHKCARLGWFPPDALPEPTFDYTRVAVAAALAGERLRLERW